MSFSIFLSSSAGGQRMQNLEMANNITIGGSIIK